MKQHRQNCIHCGKGFQAFPNEQVKFCKKKCAIAHTILKGGKWNPKMWKPRAKKFWSYEDKLKYASKI